MRDPLCRGSMRSRSLIIRAARTGSIALAAIAIALVVYLVALHLTGNFHMVVANELYRSGQPSPANLEKYVKTYGIKTVVNLRGENAGRPWYDAEIAEAKKLGIDHVDFRMSSKRLLAQGDAAGLIRLLEQTKKPVLVHCDGGADRSGLASALYLAAVSKSGEVAAENQLSLRYGYVRLPIRPAYAMYRSFENLESWLGYPNS